MRVTSNIESEGYVNSLPLDEMADDSEEEEKMNLVRFSNFIFKLICFSKRQFCSLSYS